MYTHDLRLVLRFGVHGEFIELARRLHEEESARGWTAPRIWQAVSGSVNQIVLEHDYVDEATFRLERAAFHVDPGGAGDVLAELARLAVPGTAAQHELAEVSPPSG